MNNAVHSDTKLSFDKMKTAEETALHNSNMLNLVSAATMLQESIDWHKEEIEREGKLLAEVQPFANDDRKLQDTSAVKDLFDKSRARPEFKRKAW